MDEFNHSGNHIEPLISLNGIQSFRFIAMATWAQRMDDGSYKPPLLRGQRLFVSAVRPGSLRIEDVTTPGDILPPLHPGERTLNPFDIFVSDGLHQVEVASVNGYNVGSAAATTLAETHGKQGLPTFIGPDVIFADAPLHGFAESGKELVDEKSVLVFTRTYVEGDRSAHQRLYISADTGLPVRLSRFLQDASEGWVEVMRTDYSDWNLDTPISSDVFDTTLPLLPRTQN